jgi:hypothetical protein
VPALPDLDAARLLEADAAHLRVASLHVRARQSISSEQDPRHGETEIMHV